MLIKISANTETAMLSKSKGLKSCFGRIFLIIMYVRSLVLEGVGVVDVWGWNL